MKKTIYFITTAQASSLDWWEGLTKIQQKNYLEQHPNSKFGKLGKHAPDKTEKKGHEDKPKKSKITRLKEAFAPEIKKLQKSDRQFFETDQHLPKSEARSGLAKHIRHSHKEIISPIKGQVKEWHTGCGAITKIASGKSINEHEKKALKALVVDATLLTASLAVTGGFSHGIALALKHTAFDVLKDVVLKATIRSTTKAMGASAGLTGVPEVLEMLASSKTKEDKEAEKILKTLINKIADYIEKGDISEDTWNKAIKDLQKKKKK